MKIAVLGAGVVGITTAYELALDGHEVCVFEQRNAAAEEASFAGAGLVSPGSMAPPGAAGAGIGRLLRTRTSTRVHWPLSSAEISWLRHWSRACKPATYQANQAHLHALGLYSQNHLRALSAQLELDYDRSPGCVALLLNDKDLQQAEQSLPALREAGIPCQLLTPEAVYAIEPALCASTPLLGGLHLPDDEVANGRQFALLLKSEALRLGVQFEFNAVVTRIEAGAAPHITLSHDPAPRAFDRVVVCTGLGAPHLLKPLGIHLPMIAVHGYSMNALVSEPLNAPVAAVRVGDTILSRLGNRVRVTGGFEVGGSASVKRAASLQLLYKALHDWFPGAVQHSGSANQIQEWKGSSPTLPDGLPVVGSSAQAGVWLNVGHGAHGWALACGSARILADQLGGKAHSMESQNVAAQSLSLSRFQHGR